MIRFLRALLIAARHQPYVPIHKWEDSDAKALTNFLEGATGRRLKSQLLNMVLSAQSSAVVSTNTLQHACGYANGFRGAVAAIESLATLKFSEEEGFTDSASDLDYLNPYSGSNPD